MAKKNILNLEFELPSAVIGIASNEKVWKICWKINQALELNLASAQDDVTRVKGPALYTDSESDPDFDFVFFENNLKSNQGTKLARQFRYWMVIKLKKETQPDIQDFIRRISEIDVISLVHDLSNEKDIKRLLP